MIEIHLDDEHVSEIISHAVEVYRDTESIVDAIESALPVYADNIQIAILQAIAAEIGDQ